jgi:hypothetical protein
MAGHPRFRSDLEKHVLLSNFARRGLRRATEDNDWNVYWASPHSTKAVFAPESGIRLNDSQFISHFPNHSELTRKDLMVRTAVPLPARVCVRPAHSMPLAAFAPARRSRTSSGTARSSTGRGSKGKPTQRPGPAALLTSA